VFSDFFNQIGNNAAIQNAKSISGQGGGVTTYGGTGSNKSTYVVD
jgi:hypothetical protein